MPERKCYVCGEPIGECMGFVAARDFLAGFEKEKSSLPRELCGKCGFFALFTQNVFTDILDLQD
jgi:hypothetical protein